MPGRATKPPVTLFYSYAHVDEVLRQQLEDHLSLLQRQGVLTGWHDRAVKAGEPWAEAIGEHLNSADIILLLVSPSFLASDYCYESEMLRAMERFHAGEARVIPILLRPCNWQNAPFGSLQALPRDGRAITTWENQDEAFLEVEQSLRALIERKPAISHLSRTSGTASQNREKMLLRLQTMYENLLADSLQEVAWIDLGLSTQPGAVQNAANLFLRRATQTANPIPLGTSIRQVYQEANQELLLLGEPGAGKSTLLYQLGRDLLREAVQLPARPLPVLFPLSSWAEKRLPLQDWMEEQLASPLYEVPQRLSQQWVQGEQILPLLDGLDEMEEAARPSCIVAINTYRREHPLCPLVVCSRSSEYTVASTQRRLHLQSAVEVQPFSPEQLEITLLQVGRPFAALRAELKQNTELRDLAKTPLWLTMLLLTFKNTPVRALPQRRSDLQQHLFQCYVQRMVEQKGIGTENRKRYPLDTTVRWLSWLAGQMRTHNEAVFAVELLQPDWLPKQQRFKYQWNIGLILGLVSGLGFGLSFGLLGGLIFGLSFGLIFGLSFGLIFGLIHGLIAGRAVKIEPEEALTGSWNDLSTWLILGLVFGLGLGLFAGVFIGALGLFGFWLGQLGFWLAVGLLCQVPLVFQAGLLGEFSREKLAKRFMLSPNEGIRHSIKNGLLGGLIVGLSFGLIFGLIVGLVNTLFFGLGFGLGGGLAVGLGYGLGYGLDAAVQHYTLSFWLWRTGNFPFQAGTFLEDARARHLLQRVGGTYRFVHRLLLDYFADLGSTRSSSEANGMSIPSVSTPSGKQQAEPLS